MPTSPAGCPTAKVAATRHTDRHAQGLLDGHARPPPPGCAATARARDHAPGHARRGARRRIRRCHLDGHCPHRDAHRPPRSRPHLRPRQGLRRGRAGRPPGAAGSTCGSRPTGDHGVGIHRATCPCCPSGAAITHLGRGQPRRRAGGEGVGCGPATRGRGRRTTARCRRPGRAGRGLSADVAAPSGRPARPRRDRFEGNPHRRHRRQPQRAGHRASVRGRVDCRQARASSASMRGLRCHETRTSSRGWHDAWVTTIPRPHGRRSCRE